MGARERPPWQKGGFWLEWDAGYTIRYQPGQEGLGNAWGICMDSRHTGQGWPRQEWEKEPGTGFGVCGGCSWFLT